MDSSAHMDSAVNIEACFEKFSDTFSPHIVAELNDQLIMVVRAEGDRVPWHTHDDQDEMFLLVDGVLEIQERDKQTLVQPGEFYIVNRGSEHRTVPHGHVKLILITRKDMKHTGSVKADFTKEAFDYLP